MKSLLIYIPTFNRCESLKLCISRILIETKGLESEILIHISDNNSTDETSKFLETIESEIISVSTNDINIGASLNILKVHELKNLCEYSLIIGDDDYLTGGSLKRLIAFLKANSSVDLFFINTLAYDENLRSEVLEILETNQWNSPPDGGNLKSHINQNFFCTMDELIDPKIDEVLGGSVMCYVFRSALVFNHLNGLISDHTFNMYSSYPHTLNWIYSFNPKTLSAFLHMPFTINFWHGGKEWGSLGYHRVVSEGLGFLLFELMRLNYIKNENKSIYLNHYIKISKKSIMLMIAEGCKTGKTELSIKYLNLLVENFLNIKFSEY